MTVKELTKQEVKNAIRYALPAAILALPLLLLAVIVAEQLRWGPFAPPPPKLEKEPPAASKADGSFDLDEYRPRRVVHRYLPPIENIPLKRAEEVTDEATDDELVLGVEIAGEARAYPINQLHWPMREVFNDTLGGRAIAATW